MPVDKNEMTPSLRLPLTRSDTILSYAFVRRSRMTFEEFPAAKPGDVVGFRLGYVWSDRPFYSEMPAPIVVDEDGEPAILPFTALPRRTQEAVALPFMRLQADLPRHWPLQSLIGKMARGEGGVEHFHFEVASGAALLSRENPEDEIFERRDGAPDQSGIESSFHMIVREDGTEGGPQEESRRRMAAADLFRKLHPLSGDGHEDPIVLDRPAVA